MTQFPPPFNPEQLIRDRFEKAGVVLDSLERRDFPEETIFIARVPQADLEQATELGNRLDQALQQHGFDGFVTVRQASGQPSHATIEKEVTVTDKRATELVNLLTARSRTSQVQPSLSYIPDTAQNISTVTTSRHHLIFGRRGAGKTALMVEAKKMIENDGGISTWTNIQTLRHETAGRAFMYLCKQLCETMQIRYRTQDRTPAIVPLVTALADDLDRLLISATTPDTEVLRVVPRAQAILSRFLLSNALRLFIFIDDLHYLPVREQPKFLDLVHGMVRDCDAWLKVAAIKHLARWFQASPPLGLQTGHDANHIELDLTLQKPSQAKDFLETMLRSYAKHVGIRSIHRILSPSALDRLVLASGAVPRDYLVLSASTIRQAQLREKSRVAGVQDVNKASGDAAKVKIAELEDDAASLGGNTRPIARALQILREFCIDTFKCSYFRVDFRDKETDTEEYAMMQSLMDLRLLHLINGSLSDEREAGRRSEVFMLDLSQYSGQRLKKKLNVLDFEKGTIVLKQTGTSAAKRVGDSPSKLVQLLRRGPLFRLDRLKDKAIPPTAPP